MTEKNQELINYFHPQAFLMYAKTNLGKKSKNSIKESRLTPDSNSVAVYKLSGKYDPNGAMGSVYNSRNSSGTSNIKNNFFNLQTFKISALVPELRFFKVENEKYTPFYLPITNITQDAASLNSPSRMGASAVRNFTVNYEGTDPFTAPKYLSADLELYVDNLQNIFAQSPEPGYARLADMFTISVPNHVEVKSNTGMSVRSTEMVRPIEVAATLGYSIINRDIFTQQEIQEILSSNISLRMNVYSHTINVNQDGTATIAIKYTARINSAGRDRMFSALDSPEDILARADIRQLLKPDSKESTGGKRTKNRKEILERKRKKKQAKIDEARKIMEYLQAKRKLHSIKAKPKDLENYAILGLNKKQKTELNASKRERSQDEVNTVLSSNDASLNDLDTLLDSVGKPSKTETKKVPPTSDLKDLAAGIRNKIKELDFSERELYYITFADLVESFLIKVRNNLLATKRLIDRADTREGQVALEKENLGEFLKKSSAERENIKKVIDSALKKMSTFKIVLADVTFKTYAAAGMGTEITNRINIGDIPISTFLYQKFMYDSIMNTNRNTFLIPDFLNMCTKSGGLLDKAISEWSQAEIAPNLITTTPEITSNVFSASQLRGSISTRPGGKISPDQIKGALKAFSPSTIQDECDYYMIYQSPSRENATGKPGNKKDDKKRGIYHFEIGKDRGLLKNISFSRLDVPFVQEQLLTNQVGLYDELKMVYKANIEMVGNNLFFPGSQIFIDPGTIGFGNPRDPNSAAHRLGLGGYYTVIGVNTSIRNGVTTTSLDCYYESHATNANGRGPGSGAQNINPNLPPEVAGYVSDQIGSADFTPEPPDDMGFGESENYYGECYQKMLSLKNSDGTTFALDQNMSIQLSQDFQKVPEERPDADTLTGVHKRQENFRTGTVIYHLSNGKSVKVSRTSGNLKVELVTNSKTFVS